MITLPVTAQMYHSLVQQQMPNNDNTVCVTPMQVQNFISSNSLCGSIANSNMNTSTTTYIMTANNRNVINLPPQSAGGSIKTSTMSSPATTQNINATKSRTVVRKTYMKKRVLNLAMAKHNLNQEESRRSTNNNLTNVKNRNQKLSQLKGEKVDASQSKINGNKNDSLNDDPGETKVKEEDGSVETE